MGLDIYFYKKDYVQLADCTSTRDRALFEYITEKCGVTYGNEEYGKNVALNKRQINKILRYLNKHNEYGNYNQLLADIGYAKENNQTVYINADW